MKIYLAGPMRGRPNGNQEAFEQAAKWLRAKGHEVWSPAEQEMVPAHQWDDPVLECLKVDLPALMGCEAIVLLPNWHHSRGARVEVHVASVCKIQVCELYNDELFTIEPEFFYNMRSHETV